MPRRPRRNTHRRSPAEVAHEAVKDDLATAPTSGHP